MNYVDLTWIIPREWVISTGISPAAHPVQLAKTIRAASPMASPKGGPCAVPVHGNLSEVGGYRIRRYKFQLPHLALRNRNRDSGVVVQGRRHHETSVGMVLTMITANRRTARRPQRGGLVGGCASARLAHVPNFFSLALRTRMKPRGLGLGLSLPVRRGRRQRILRAGPRAKMPGSIA